MIAPTLCGRRLIGRAKELEALHDARRALSGARGGVVLVGGEAGIGKTRLLSEFKAALTGGRSPYFALGECLEDAPQPFGPIRSLLGRLTQLLPGVLSDPTPLTLRVLGLLVPHALTERGLAAQRPAAVEKMELFTGVLRYLQALAAHRALILALEDLHWADSATLELVEFIAPRIAGFKILVVGTYRDDETGNDASRAEALTRLRMPSNGSKLALKPLAEDNVRALIADALGAKRALAEREVRDIVARSEGNPLFTQELVKKALERRHDATNGVALPDSIRMMVLARVAHLTRDERDVLEYAAVLGTRFDVHTLALVMERREADVSRAVGRSRALNLVIREAIAPRMFRFRHALTRQTIYDDPLLVTTRRLHERVVRSLEALADPAARIDELAYHSWKAGLREPTLRYSERAGDAALAVRGSVQAGTYFERALDSASDDQTRIRLLGKAGEAYTLASEHDPVSRTLS